MQQNEPHHSYTVRRSQRARRVRLVVTPRDGLVVVAPPGFSERRIPQIVEAHAAWIARTLERTSEQRERIERAGTAPLPQRVSMPGIEMEWDVVCVPDGRAGVRGRVRGSELVLSGQIEDRAAVHKALRRAVSRAANERLPLLLGGIEAETGWNATRVTVRWQKTRWGSCSAARAVSLNATLAFLPPRLVRYVLVHELAHTRRMDHSPVFWALVAGQEASWRTLRRELADAWRHVPVWADPS